MDSVFNQIPTESVDLTNFKMVQTNKGRPKLYCDGYFNITDSETTSQIVWKCERSGNKTTLRCSGRVSTGLNKLPSVTIRKDHHHRPEPAQLFALEAVQEMLERAKISSDKPRTIMKNCQLNVDSEAAVHLIRPKNIQKRICSIRSKIN